MSGFLSMMIGASGTFKAIISTNQQELNLASWAASNGWDTSSPAEITINSGVYIWSNNTSTPALTTGNFPISLKIINNGKIIGKGGNGSSSASSVVAGYPGGHAISLGCNCTIDSTSGYIAGGGGGGASSHRNYVTGGGGGGAGGGTGGTGAAGGAIGTSGSNGSNSSPGYGSASGGGGRIIPASRVYTTLYYPNGANYYGTGGSGGGSPACATDGGGMLVAGWGGGNEDAGNYNTMSGSWYSQGGGGGWGANGGASYNVLSQTAAGGAAGKAISKNGYTVTWVGGTEPANIYGAVS